AFGKEAYLLTGYLNLAKILEITLNNGTDPVSGAAVRTTRSLSERLSHVALFRRGGRHTTVGSTAMPRWPADNRTVPGLRSQSATGYAPPW
ncbi:MAG: pyruvate formate lyase family protein, partial [Lentisphaeria bacterium]|nr:pyruvate formate lyase family protein [Lentisphaeria bacterium]